MPSGSSGGGGGSHFGGGGGGGSHFGGSSGGGRSSRPTGFRNGRRVVFIHTHGGRSRYMYSWADSLCSVLSIFLFFSIFTFLLVCISIHSFDQDLTLIENDYNYYQQMIKSAEENPDKYIVEGTVISPRYNETAEKWYIEYYITAFYSGEKNYGYTFSIYTAQEAAQFKAGDVIMLAVNEYPITLLTDSINLDYKDIPLERDGEYVQIKESKQSAVTITVISGIVTVGLIVAIILIKKFNTKEDDTPDPITTTSLSKKRYCKYCGSSIATNSEKCPNCGAGENYEKD